MTRRFGANVIEGRYVRSNAYSLYAAGSYAEAAEKFEDAVRAYEAAEVEDPSSPEIWTRLGAVYCRLSRFNASKDAFNEALKRDATYAPLWNERARCSLAQGNLEEGLRFAKHSRALEPLDSEATLLVVDALKQLGRDAETERELFGLLVVGPRTPGAFDAFVDYAERAQRSDLLAYAMGNRRDVNGRTRRRNEVDRLDTAIVNNDRVGAKKLAHAMAMPAGQLAIRAAAWGAADFAREEAERVEQTDPQDICANIAAAYAAHLQMDEPHFLAATLKVQHARPEKLPTLADLLWKELLFMAGDTAAFLEAGGQSAFKEVAGDDALTRAVRKRLEQSSRLTQSPD